MVTNSHLPLLLASYLGRRSFRGVFHVRLLSGGGGFALFRGLGTVAGPSHSSYDGCAAHNLCGPGLESSSSGVPSSAAGGALFIPDLLLRSCARNVSCPSGHFSLVQCLWHCLTSHHIVVVDVHSLSVERHLVRTASVARFSRPGHPLNSYLLHLPPMRTRTQPYLIRGCVLVTRFSLDSLYNIGIHEMCNPREM